MKKLVMTPRNQAVIEAIAEAVQETPEAILGHVDLCLTMSVERNVSLGDALMAFEQTALLICGIRFGLRAAKALRDKLDAIAAATPAHETSQAQIKANNANRSLN